MKSEIAVRRGFRPEIQGLRAVAVLLVIAYHLYPNRVSGGYVGVDVFFVLGHLSPNCIEANPGDPLACSTTRAEGVVPDAEADAVAGAPDGVHLIDLTDRFCDQERCYAVVGDVMVYRDSSHLTQEYSTLLMPYLGRAFDAVDAKRG